MIKRLCLIVILVILCFINFSQAKSNVSKTNETPFDIEQVIKQVGHPRMNLDKDKAVLSGEFLADTNPVYLITEGVQAEAAVAFDGENYLVVWTEGESGNDQLIAGCRVSKTGDILDPNGFGIGFAADDQRLASVAFDGTNYLVVWQDYRSGSNWDIYGTRVTKDGEVLDPSGIPISTASDDQENPSVVFGDTYYLVVWQDYRSGSTYDVYSARIRTSGSVVDGSGILISNNTTDQIHPSVAFGDTNYFVVWQDGRNGNDDIYGCRVSQAGSRLDGANGVVISTNTYNQQNPSIAFSSNNYLVTWQDNRNGNNDIYGCRVNQLGIRLDGTDGFMITNATNDQTGPKVSFDGTNYFVAWTDGRNGSGNFDIYGCRINQNATILDPSGIEITAVVDNQEYCSVAFDGTNYLVVWQDDRNIDSDIYCSRFKPSTPIVLDSLGIAITIYTNQQIFPAVGFDGVNYLVVWQDYRSGNTCDLYGIRVDVNGNLLDSAAFVIDSAANDQHNLAIAFDGNNYLVVWQDERSGNANIYGRLISPGGVVGSEIIICNESHNQYYPAVAYKDTNYLVVWTDYRNHGVTNWDIYGCFVSRAGIVSSAFAITSEVNIQERPAVACDNTNYIVVWEDRRNGSKYDIFGSRVDSTGVVLDPNGIPISATTNDQLYPSVAFDGTNYLIVWTDKRSYSTTNNDIYGIRLNQTGSVIGSDIAISTAAHSQIYPKVAFDGSNYLVVWTDNRSNTNYDIYGSRVNTAGTIDFTVAVSLQGNDQTYPMITRGNSSQLFVVFQGWAGTIGDMQYNTARTWCKILNVIKGWVRKTDMPSAIAGKGVKDGGSMVAVSGNKGEPVLYAFRGYKSNEFYKFDGNWILMDSMRYGYKFGVTPPTVNKKKVGKGASLCYNGTNIIYATKGNSTKEFWMYEIDKNIWTAKAYVPVAKYLKGGTSTALYNNKIYLLAGGQKITDSTLFVYDPSADTLNGIPWDTLKRAPIIPSYKAWKDGSCISVMGNRIYALKGGDKFNWFFAYNPANNTWGTRESIPLLEPVLDRKNKVKDGAAITNDGTIIYAIKGGGKQDFWKFTPNTTPPDSGVWTTSDTITRSDKKSVPKTGASLAYINGNVYLLKGNNKPEFWQYIPTVVNSEKQIPNSCNKAIMSEVCSNPISLFAVAPNPVTQNALIKYSVPISGKVMLKLYNTTGRLIRTLVNDNCESGSYTLNLSVNSLAKGIYFLKYENRENKMQVKLIVQ